MTFFKVSFSSDSLEGLNSLSGMSASRGNSESFPTAQDTLPPPLPSSQSRENGLSGESSNRNGSAPPDPPIHDTGISDSRASDADQVAPPPLPISDGTTEDGHPFPAETPPPPAPDSGNPNAGDDQAEEEIGSPPSPTKRKSKSSKKTPKA